jgi:hypothetical protein
LQRIQFQSHQLPQLVPELELHRVLHQEQVLVLVRHRPLHLAEHLVEHLVEHLALEQAVEQVLEQVLEQGRVLGPEPDQVLERAADRLRGQGLPLQLKNRNATNQHERLSSL